MIRNIEYRHNGQMIRREQAHYFHNIAKLFINFGAVYEVLDVEPEGDTLVCNCRRLGPPPPTNQPPDPASAFCHECCGPCDAAVHRESPFNDHCNGDGLGPHRDY